jgi:hypothetical protein
MSQPEINWDGKSGANYAYVVYTIGHSFREEPANYIYAKERVPGHWIPVYIGQTSDLKDRIAYHKKEKCAIRKGATHIHMHPGSSSEIERRTEQADLINNWNPECNGQ